MSRRAGWPSIVETPDPVAAPPIVIPPDVAEHATHDRVLVWQRGNEVIEQTARQALSLIGKGWTALGLADAAEARPFPNAPAAAPIAEPQKTKK